MALVGADLQGLDRLKTTFDRGADDLERLGAIATDGATHLQGLWHGADAAEFTRIWMGRHRPAIAQAVSALREAAAAVESERGQQERASAVADGLGTGTTGGTGPTGVLTGGDGDQGSGTGKIKDEVRIVGWEESTDPLFRSPGGEDGVHANDIDQQSLGDCYYVAALAGLANHDPDLIRNAIVDNGDGTYTVTLWEERDGRYQTVEVTVTAEMPVTETWNDTKDAWVESDRFTLGDADGELWPRLFEKAYAQHLGDGDLIAGYSEIIGGDGADALTALTGVPAQTAGSGELTIQELSDLHDQGVLLPASQRHQPGSSWWARNFGGDTTGDYDIGGYELTTRHQYWIEDIDVANDTVIVRNPWGYESGNKYLIELSYEEFTEGFREVDYIPTTDAAPPAEAAPASEATIPSPGGPR